jgi:hypothetical protein
MLEGPTVSPPIHLGKLRFVTMKIYQDRVAAGQTSGERPPIRHAGAADIPLSPIKSQATMGNCSAGTASTSKREAVVYI